MSSDESEGGESRGIQSVEVAGRALEALCAAGARATLKQLSAAAGMSASKMHRYMASLLRIGLAAQGEDGRYRLGPMAVRLGVAAIGQLDIVDATGRAAETLAEDLGLSVHVSLWGDWGPVVIRLHQGISPVLSTVRLGSVLPLSRSATGLVYLAFGKAALTEPALEREVAGTASPVDRFRLAEAVRGARLRGFAVADGTVMPGLQAIAGPVFDFQGDLACAVSVTGTDRAMLDAGSVCTRRLLAACQAVSARAGAQRTN